MKSILKNTNVIASGMYKVHTRPNQTRTPQLPQDNRKTNKRVSFSTGVIFTTSVSRPQLKSNQLEDRVMHNNSEGNKQQVEDHRRNFMFSNNKTSVTACNDRYTWTHFLRSKDETPEVLIDFLRLVQRGLHAQVRTVRTDKDTEFLNKTLHAYFAKEGIEHQTSTARTPEQNGVVGRRNRALVEAARTMLSAAKVPLYFWAEAIVTACFTQNRSLVIPRHEKTPYHIINGRKPSVNSSPGPQSQKNVPQAAETVTTSNKLDLLFSPMFDELLNGTTPVVSKYSAVTAADVPDQRQPVAADIPPLNIQITPETTSQAPTQAPTHTFYRPHPSEHRWTKDHPLEQVIGNPSQSIRTRRQLEADGEMCMFTLTMSRTELKNINEAMADSTWIEAMQEELSQFDRLNVWELVDRPLCKNVINMKRLWKNKRDKENTVIRNKARLVAKGYNQHEGIDFE
ncbi:retrovirus-related pol polyprotein from transposon TNT 1-94 [Tanacetum coccineum]